MAVPMGDNPNGSYGPTFGRRHGMAREGMEKILGSYNDAQSGRGDVMDKLAPRVASPFDLQRNKNQEMQNMMNVLKTTGQFTPEMLNAFGYGGQRMQQKGMAGLDGFVHGTGEKGGGSVFVPANPYPGQHQFDRNRAASQFSGPRA
jgi:hypothetical protein